MYKNKTFLGIIPARGGSKRLPGKNILNLHGKPLIAWTIEAGLKSKYLDKIVVSSDDDEILDIADQFKAHTLKRPVELASDTTTSFDAINHVINNSKKSIDKLKDLNYDIQASPRDINLFYIQKDIRERIVNKVLSISSNIRWVEVRVCKINPPIDVDVQNVSVVIKKER